MFVYMTGVTMRKLMTTASWSLSAHMSTRMMKLTTGTVRITVINGVRRASTTVTRARRPR